FSHKPVVEMIVDLGAFADRFTTEINGFNERLLSLFPGLTYHYCSPGYEGGFEQRLNEGTLISHVTEHVALELQCIMGYEVYFGKTRVIDEPYKYCIVYEHINQKCAQDYGYYAAEIVVALARNEFVPITRILNQLYQISTESDLGPSTLAIFKEARRRKIPVRRIGEDSLLQLGYGKQMRLIEASLPGGTSCIAVELAKNKQLAKNLLQEHNLPVPAGSIADTEKTAVQIAAQIGYPVVVKPLDGNQGKNVTANITDETSLRKAYRISSSYSRWVIVEKFIRGRDYRVLVVGNKVSAVAERKPPYIIGDGFHSVSELIDEENKNPNRGNGHEKPLTRIRIDSIAKEFLAGQGYKMCDIPRIGAVVYLRSNGNLSTGGSSRDCTAEIHAANKLLAVQAAQVIGLEVAGIDIVMDDISNVLTAQNGAIIEINAAPGLRMHLCPRDGQGRNVAADIIDHMYPQGTDYSIPIVSITGTNGKTTVTRMVSHVLSLTGQKVGMTCSSGTYIGQECILQGDNTGPDSARSILYNKDVEIAVLETARGGIIRRGLGYDLADVGVVVNISEDHLGIDGVYSLKDLAFVKSLVIEAVKTTGYAVLNADDHMTEFLAAQRSGQLILFSQKINNPLLISHINAGGMAVVAHQGLVFFYKDGLKTVLMGVNDIPVTYAGNAICNIENSLAAAASLFAVEIPYETIRLGLMTFKPDPAANAGRLNLFDLEHFRIILDYGHNIGGYKAVIQFASTLNPARLIGIIGMPGDRSNEAIFEVGKFSGQSFAKIYIKEDQDLRGREPGEVAGILFHGALAGGGDGAAITVLSSEIDALQAAIDNAFPGDIIIMFYEDFDTSFGFINKLFAAQVHEMPLLSDNQPPQPALEYNH
ncbi:MAG: cyanophycin synthetase, partial [Syntrophomonas sp.]|nr:cyanophycin synthetase [Syntrophomonas sp.]